MDRQSYEQIHRVRFLYSRCFTWFWIAGLCVVHGLFFRDWTIALVAACTSLSAVHVFCIQMFGAKSEGGLFQCAASLDRLIAAERKDTRKKELLRVVHPPDPRDN